MSDLVTLAELDNFAQRTLDSDAAALALDIAEGLVKDYVRHTFTKDEHTIELDGPGSPVILLPGPPILAVSQVDETTGTSTRTTETLDEWVDYEWHRSGVLRRRRKNWPQHARSIGVTFERGYETIPDTARGMILKVALRGVDNPGELKQESIGRYSYTRGGNSEGGSGLALMAAEKVALDEYRLTESERDLLATSTVGS